MDSPSLAPYIMRHRFRPAAALVFACLPLFAVDACAAAGADPLAAEQWKTRPLVVAAPTADAPIITGVTRALASTAISDAFADREMVLYTVVGDEARRNGQLLPPGSASALAKALSLDLRGQGEAVLVGKDGGVKLRQQGRVDFDKIFPTIDAMPMRRR